MKQSLTEGNVGSVAQGDSGNGVDLPLALF